MMKPVLLLVGLIACTPRAPTDCASNALRLELDLPKENSILGRYVTYVQPLGGALAKRRTVHGCESAPDARRRCEADGCIWLSESCVEKGFLWPELNCNVCSDGIGHAVPRGMHDCRIYTYRWTGSKWIILNRISGERA
jgi:hypothetical protein